MRQNSPMSSVPSSRETKTLRRRLVQRPHQQGVRQRMYDIIFEAETAEGRAFDIGLLIAIVASIILVSLETLPEYQILRVVNGETIETLPMWLVIGEWLLTVLFTLEYVARLVCVKNPLKYATSFWGIVDLLSILPGYAALLTGSSTRSFVILRSVRLLRVFRVLKLWRMMSQADELADAIWHSRDKIVVFLSVVLVAVTISGTLMYHIESVMFGSLPDSEFTSIPQAMYWAIVTMTTVGYGDVVPHTTIGKIISAALILLGYSLIIVPTGFVSAELSKQGKEAVQLHPCPKCEATRHQSDAQYCFRCGSDLDRSS